MYRKFDKIYRIEMPNYPIKGKYFLAKSKEKLLFDSDVTITEKIDGANTSINKVDNEIKLYRKLGPIDHSHPQFSFFQNQWFWENQNKLNKLPNNLILYGELMRVVHTMKYDKLPDWWLAFAGYDLKQKQYISWDELTIICKEAGLYQVPLLYRGIITKNKLDKLMPIKSKFGPIAEGMTVYNYPNQVFGKYVKAEFVKAVEDSPFWRDKEIELNKAV